MIKNKYLKNIFELNIAVCLMGTSGALGRYIDLPVPITIWLRALIASVILFLFCKLKGLDLTIQKQDKGMLLLSGVLMGLHWLTYFYSLRLSNVAIGMISLFTFPVITSFLEPIILNSKFQKTQLLLGGLALLGIYFLVPNFDFQNNYSIALLLGIISAFFYSLRNILTKSRTGHYNGSVIMMYQLIIISILLAPSYVLFDNINVLNQLPANLTLALLTTAIGHTLFLHSLKNFSVTSASIIGSSQLLYGIIFGVIFLNEYPNSNSIIGGLLILTSVLLESIRTYKKPLLARD